MTFHDFGFSQYERQKRAKQNRNDHMLARRTLRDTQSPTQWIKLQGQIRGCIVRLNVGAGRTVLCEHQESDNCLAIRREDGRTFKVVYDPELYCVSICGLELCELKLMVRQVDGKDTAVWIEPHKGEIRHDNEIATFAISGLLREI